MTKSRIKHHWDLIHDSMPLIRLGLHDTVELQSMSQGSHIWIADGRIYCTDTVTGIKDYWVLSDLVARYALDWRPIRLGSV